MIENSCLTNLCRLVEEIHYDGIPKDVTEKTALCLADFIGVFCAGSVRAESEALYAALGADAMAGSCENTAFWMGGVARLLDLDDGHRFAMGHPGVVLNTTALACAIANPEVKMHTVLEALVRGYEVYCYQGRIINPSAYLERGFDATAICGAAGAAAVAGTIMGLDGERIKHGVSLAMSLCGGLNQYSIDGGAPKYLCAGWAAKLGIISAQLAKTGLTGPEFIFEGRLGYINGFSPKPNTDRMAKESIAWEVRDVYLKRYACVRRIHPTLDVVEELCKAHQLDESQIRQVRVYGGKFICDAAIYHPADVVKAQTSIPYSVAVLLHFGQVSSDLMDENLNNAAVAELSDRIAVLYDPAFTELTKKEPSLWGASRVEIECGDGTVYASGRNIALGDPEMPFSKEEMHEKFLRLAEAVQNERFSPEKLWCSVDQSVEENTVKPLIDALSPALRFTAAH